MSPIRKSEQAKYPPDWRAIVLRILARAEYRCEFLRADGSRCDVPDRKIIARQLADLEKWTTWDDADKHWPPELYRLVRIVLTIAHLDHNPENGDEANLRAGCQLHHLRYDVDQHRENAALTRREKKGNAELFPGVM